MPQATPLLGAAIGGVILIAATLITKTPDIEQDLSKRSRQALDTAGLHATRLSISGRDVTLSGPSQGESLDNKGVELVSSLWGVRHVNAEFDAPKTEQDILLTKTLQEQISGLYYEGIHADVYRGHALIRGRSPGVIAQSKIVELATANPGITSITSHFTNAAGDLISEAELDEARDCATALQDQLAKGIINFASASAEITPDSFAMLDALAAIVADCPESTVIISGHTDSSGDPSFNQALSASRATAVGEYLADAGVDADHIVTRGYGASRPIADNSDQAGRAQNRRIEFSVQL